MDKEQRPMNRKDEQFGRKMAIWFLREAGFDVDELSPKAWNAFKQISPSIYCIPALRKDFEKGVRISSLMIKYRMSYYQVKERLEGKKWVRRYNRNKDK